jgi:hypothetical protein
MAYGWQLLFTHDRTCGALAAKTGAVVLKEQVVHKYLARKFEQHKQINTAIILFASEKQECYN